MEKRSVEERPALTSAKKLKTDSSQMLKTLHHHMDMVVEEVELKENQLQVLSLKLSEIQKQVEQQTDKLKATEIEARDKENTIQVLSLKFAEIQNQIEQQTDKLKAAEVEARDKENALGLIRNQIKSEEETLKKTGVELELKKAELKKIELRLRSSVLVKQEPLHPTVSSETGLSPGDAFLLREFSSASISRHEVSRYLGAISTPAKFVLDLVERQLRNAQRRQKLDLQEPVVKNLVLFLEDLAGMGGSVEPQLKFKAKELASVWKENITIVAPRSSLEALAFLLFIVAFGLNSLINEEETALLASSVCHYAQGPKLFQFLGLKLKVAELVRDLIEDHQYIPAVRMICSLRREDCSLKLKDFSPTTLLMKEITDLRRSAMGKVQNKDVGRLRAVVELVADYKLDIDLPGELIAKLMLLRENSTPPELHCSVKAAEATRSGVDLVVPKTETKPFVNPSTTCSY